MSQENTSTSAIEQLERMWPTVDGEVRTAIALLTALSTANEEVGRLGGHVNWYGGNCYAAIRTGLVASLASTLARLFEASSDAATLSRLSNLMGRARTELAERARDWPIDGPATVLEAIAEAAAALKAPDTKKSLAPLKALRDARLAHALFEKTPTPPIYADITHLTEVAALVASRASLVIRGLSWEPSEVIEERRRTTP